MNKIVKIISSSIVAVSMTTVAFAGANFGISANHVKMTTDGSETLKQSSNVTKKSVSKTATIPSVFFEYEFDGGFVLGLDMIPGEADIGGSKSTASTMAMNNGAASAHEDRAITKTASASLSNHNTLYAEYHMAGFFVRVGAGQVTLLTEESLPTGASYPNADLNFKTAGIGYRHVTDSGMFIKAFVSKSTYDEAVLKSTGSDAVTTIKGEPETDTLSIAIGKQF